MLNGQVLRPEAYVPRPATPPVQPLEYRVLRAAAGYGVYVGDARVGYDLRRQAANELAARLAAESTAAGKDAVSYPCLDED